MSIASEITRLQNIKTNIRTALVNKGITSASTHDMADFATDISNISSGGATITVTYGSQFYNKTMTCTKGTTTYTETTTSSGSTVFNVDSSGTWTITCNGVSRTVDVVLEYSTQMAITSSIAVYGPASDTISFTDVTGAKTVTTDTNGEGSVSISYIPNDSITFTSSKAKNPANLSEEYSKSITMTDGISEIYIMPDGIIIYWYGYINGLQTCSASNGWDLYSQYDNMSWSSNSPQYNTNNITMQTENAVGKVCGVGKSTAINLSDKSAIKIIYNAENISSGNGQAVLSNTTSKRAYEATSSSYNVSYIPLSYTNAPTLYTKNISSFSDSRYISTCAAQQQGKQILYALWVE